MLRATYLLSFFLFNLALNALAQQNSLAPASYHLIGRCHDYSTATGLKASIYAIVDGSRQKIGQGAEADQIGTKSGTFDVLLPATASHVVLEMNGYHTVTLPVHFTPGIPDGARFAFYNLAAMTPLDSSPTAVPSALVDFLSLCFLESDSSTYSTWLDLMNTQSSRRYSVPTLTSPSGKTIHVPTIPGNYTAKLLTADGHVVSAERFEIGPGVTFKAFRVGKQPETEKTTEPTVSKQIPPPASLSIDTTSTVRRPIIAKSSIVTVPIVTAPSIATLYFDQSSPDLRPQTCISLDSLAPILMAQPNLQATVTGYTDNVGQRNLNLTLSEYRARAVATYLTKRGVPTERLMVRWKGPDSTASAQASEADKIKSRRVVIQVAPR